MEIAKRLNAIIAQLLPFLSQEVRLHCSLKEKEYRISTYFSVTDYYAIKKAIEIPPQQNQPALT
jgi:hypothetical protein